MLQNRGFGSPGGCYGQELTGNPGGSWSGRLGSHGGHLEVSDYDRPLAVMQPAKDQQRRRSVDQRRHASGVFVSEDDHVAHTAAFPKMIHVMAESPSSRSLRNVSTACGMVSKQERTAPVQARIVTITDVTSFAPRATCQRLLRLPTMTYIAALSRGGVAPRRGTAARRAAGVGGSGLPHTASRPPWSPNMNSWSRFGTCARP